MGFDGMRSRKQIKRRLCFSTNPHLEPPPLICSSPMIGVLLNLINYIQQVWQQLIHSWDFDNWMKLLMLEPLRFPPLKCLCPAGQTFINHSIPWRQCRWPTAVACAASKLCLWLTRSLTLFRRCHPFQNTGNSSSPGDSGSTSGLWWRHRWLDNNSGRCLEDNSEQCIRDWSRRIAWQCIHRWLQTAAARPYRILKQ